MTPDVLDQIGKLMPAIEAHMRISKQVERGVFSLCDYTGNWCSPECLILFHCGLRGAITKSRRY